MPDYRSPGALLTGLRRHRAGRIVVFGDVVDDVVVVPSGPIREDTDTPSSIRNRAGGSAANAAAWMASLGASVDFVGVVGHDDVARHSGLLARSGVRPHLTGDPSLPTGAIIVIVDGERRTMLTEKGANQRMTPAAVTDRLLAGAAVLHFTGYSVFSQESQADLHNLFARASAHGVRISVDPASAGFIADFGIENFLDAVAGAHLFFPNLEEGRILTNLDDPLDIVESLGERFDIVALTLDTAGVIVAESGMPTTTVSAVAVPIVDPIGAGDAFAAGFLTAWVSGVGSMAAASAGARAGALAVSTIGGRPRI
jgi:sugar/nucleoside kinase (ribokinase family)